VVLLQRGRVAFDGRPEDALTRGHLSNVYGGEVDVERSGDYFFMRNV
jgi:ABC-type hemin transport system ATPase subunit